MEQQVTRIAKQVVRDLRNPLTFVPVMLSAKAELVKKGVNPEEFTQEHLMYSLAIIRIAQEKGKVFPKELLLRVVDQVKLELRRD